MVRCQVKNCKNYWGKNKKEIPIRYFRFPKDEFFREKWAQATGLTSVTAKHPRICSIHFSDESYAEDWIQKTYNLPCTTKRLLRGDAIPTLHLEEEQSFCREGEAIDFRERDSEELENLTEDSEDYQFPESSEEEGQCEIKMTTVTKQNVLFNELCRACLRKSNNMRYLMNTADETTKTLLTQFSSFLNKELQFSRLYPCYLCPTCEWKLKASFEFRSLCLKSDQCITSILEQTNLIQRKLVVEDGNGAKNKVAESNKKTIQNQKIEALIEIKDEDTDEETYEITQDDDNSSSDYDLFEKVEMVQEDTEHAESHKLVDHSYHSETTLTNRRHLLNSIKLENQHPWQTKWNMKSVQNQQSVQDRYKLSTKLKLVRYPRDEVQAIIDAVEQKRAEEIECLFCNTACQGQRALCRHVGSSHKDRKDNWCSTCNEIVEDVSTHRKDGHKDQLTCPFCHKKLPSIGKFKAHLHTHIMIEKEFKCVRCDIPFQSERNLMIHLRRVHMSDALYACDSCPQKYRSEVQLQLHQKIHYKQKHKECPDCLVKFNTSEEIDRHVCTQQNKAILESFDGNKNFCKLCNRRVRSMAVHYKRWHDASDKKEKKSKTGQNLYQYLCALCGKNYRTQFSLNIHMRRHTGDKPFECRFCSMRMVSKTAIKTHERTHTGEKPYICSYCGKGFGTKSTLSYHMKIHTGKTNQCPMCPKKFARPIEMRVHMHSHTGERPFKCDVCGQGFIQHCHLSQHRLKHTGERPYRCEFCDKAYPHPNTLKKHVKIVHLGEKFLKCRFCNFECNQWIYLKRHKEENHMGAEMEEDSS